MKLWRQWYLSCVLCTLVGSMTISLYANHRSNTACAWQVPCYPRTVCYLFHIMNDGITNDSSKVICTHLKRPSVNHFVGMKARKHTIYAICYSSDLETYLIINLIKIFLNVNICECKLNRTQNLGVSFISVISCHFHYFHKTFCN